MSIRVNTESSLDVLLPFVSYITHQGSLGQFQILNPHKYIETCSSFSSLQTLFFVSHVPDGTYLLLANKSTRKVMKQKCLCLSGKKENIIQDKTFENVWSQISNKNYLWKSVCVFVHGFLECQHLSNICGVLDHSNKKLFFWSFLCSAFGVI